MARTYRRDARGRFAGAGYSGQTSGRGARLKAGGKSRAGGGTRMKSAQVRGTITRPANFRLGAAKPKPVAEPAKKSGRAKGKSLNQRAKALMAVHRNAIIKYEVSQRTAGTRSTKAKQKAKREVSAAINKLTPAQQVKIAQNWVKKTRDKRAKEARTNMSLQASARSVRASNARMANARAKIERFAENAPSILADKSQPLNKRKLANAVSKGLMRGYVKRGGGVGYSKTADKNQYDADRTAKSYFIGKQRREVARRAIAEAQPKMGRTLTKKANRQPFATKKRLPKAQRVTAARPASTIKGRDTLKGIGAYQRSLIKQAKGGVRTAARYARGRQARPGFQRWTNKRPAAPRR